MDICEMTDRLMGRLLDDVSNNLGATRARALLPILESFRVIQLSHIPTVVQMYLMTSLVMTRHTSALPICKPWGRHFFLQPLNSFSTPHLVIRQNYSCQHGLRAHCQQDLCQRCRARRANRLCDRLPSQPRRGEKTRQARAEGETTAAHRPRWGLSVFFAFSKVKITSASSGCLHA
jgi:hypothetical protein